VNLCTNECDYKSDGTCDDGGATSEWTACERGSDCLDCGPRAFFSPPAPSAPSAPPAVPPPPSPQSAAPVRDDDARQTADARQTDDTAVLVVGIVGGGIVVLLLCAIGAFVLIRQRLKKVRLEKARAIEDADAKLEAMAQRMSRLNHVVMMSSKAANSATSALKLEKSRSRCQVQVEGQKGDSAPSSNLIKRSKSDAALGNRIKRSHSDLAPKLSSGALLSSPSSEVLPRRPLAGAPAHAGAGRANGANGANGASHLPSHLSDATAQQALWITSQEHEADHREHEENVEEAISKRFDFAAIDATLDKVEASAAGIDAKVGKSLVGGTQDEMKV
jgi:hypothetical protein